MANDVTTLTLAVDTTQVKTATLSLEEMAAAGTQAEVSTGKLAKTTEKSLGASAAAAAKGKVAFTDLASAAEKLGPNAAKQLAAALGDVQNAAIKAKEAVKQIGSASLGNSSDNALRAQLAAEAKQHVASNRFNAKLSDRSQSASNIDVRTLLGLPSLQEVSTFSRSLEAKLKEEATRVAETTKFKSSNLGAKVSPRELLGLPPEAEMKSFSASLKAQLQEGVVPAKFVQSIEQQASAFGKTKEELLAIKAAQLGVAEQAGETIAKLTAAKQAAAGTDFIKSLEQQAASVGKTNAELLAMKAAELGVADKAKNYIAQIAEAGKHTEEFGFKTAASKRELLVLAHELSQGNFKRFGGSMLVLGEQTGIAGALFSGAGIAALGLAAAVGVVAYAFHKGATEQKEMNDALILTGNYAGATSDSLDAMAQSAVKSGGSIGEAKKSVIELAASGKFTGDQIGYITDAVVALEHATGKSASGTIKEFESLTVQGFGNSARATDTVQRAIVKLNEQYHFLTEATFEQIHALEKEGQVQQASILATQTYADVTKKRADEIVQNLGYIARAWNAVKEEAGKAIDNLSNIGKNATPASEVERLTKALKEPNLLPGVFNSTSRNEAIKKAQGELAEAQRQLTAENKKAADQQAETIKQDEAVHAAARINTDDAKLQKNSLTELQKALKEYADDVEKIRTVNPNSPLITPNAIAAHKEAIRKAHTDKSGVSEGNQVLRANLDSDIKSIQDILVKERDAFSFNDRFLQGLYQAGKVSLEDYYNARRDVSRQGIEAEIATLEADSKRREEFIKKSSDPSDKIKERTKINENTEQISRLRSQGIREQDLLNQEATASFKQLDESVANYNATLEQLLGNEEKAASIRASIAIQNARVLSSQKGGSAIDVKAYERALAIQNQFNSVQQRTSALSAAARTAEEAFAEAAEQRGLSLRDTETGIYQIRKVQLDQLGELVKKAKELADASTNPAIKQFAADLALEYAKAAKSVDPALEKLKQANKELAQSIADSITNLPKTFSDAYSRRRQESFDDIKNQKSEYNQRIDQLEQYLAESSDKQDKARLRERIKKLQEERDSTKRESKASSFFKTIGETVLAPIGQQVLSTITKVSVSDPLQKMLENSLNSLTTGDGPIGKFFKDAFGVKDDPLATAQAAQALAVETTTTALEAFRDMLLAASNALPGASSVAGVNGETAPSSNIGIPPPIDSELEGNVTNFGDTINAANDSSKDLAKTIPAVTNVLSRLGGVTNSASSALSLLPSIISLISSSASTSSASSAGGGIFGAIAGAFSNGSSSGAMSNELFHDGGIAGQPTMRRTTASNVFAGATKYHRGGIAGLQPDEVPAILMGGAKGKREEILTAKDPRHRDNLLNPTNRPYQRGQHSAGNAQTTNNKNSVINQEFHFNTGGASVDRRTAQMAGAEIFRQTARANKRYN